MHLLISRSISFIFTSADIKFLFISDDIIIIIWFEVCLRFKVCFRLFIYFNTFNFYIFLFFQFFIFFMNFAWTLKIPPLKRWSQTIYSSGYGIWRNMVSTGYGYGTVFE